MQILSFRDSNSRPNPQKSVSRWKNAAVFSSRDSRANTRLALKASHGKNATPACWTGKFAKEGSEPKATRGGLGDSPPMNNSPPGTAKRLDSGKCAILARRAGEFEGHAPHWIIVPWDRKEAAGGPRGLGAEGDQRGFGGQSPNE